MRLGLTHQLLNVPPCVSLSGDTTGASAISTLPNPGALRMAFLFGRPVTSGTTVSRKTLQRWRAGAVPNADPGSPLLV